jgi:hypothetical protein
MRAHEDLHAPRMQTGVTYRAQRKKNFNELNELNERNEKHQGDTCGVVGA